MEFLLSKDVFILPPVLKRTPWVTVLSFLCGAVPLYPGTRPAPAPAPASGAPALPGQPVLGPDALCMRVLQLRRAHIWPYGSVLCAGVSATRVSCDFPSVRLSVLTVQRVFSTSRFPAVTLLPNPPWGL